MYEDEERPYDAHEHHEHHTGDHARMHEAATRLYVLYTMALTKK